MANLCRSSSSSASGPHRIYGAVTVMHYTEDAWFVPDSRNVLVSSIARQKTRTRSERKQNNQIELASVSMTAFAEQSAKRILHVAYSVCIKTS